MSTDCELLRIYAEHGDQAAFAEVVRRHVNWVYSTALRLTAGDAHLAEDVAQSVFTDLARKARVLVRHPALGGWLHTATRYAAAKAVARESARRVREQEAFTMQTNLTAPEISWEQLRPILDDAIGRLAEGDRNIVVLRFFEGKSHHEVGDLLGLSEDTARKRTERAVEKLRMHFTRRGIAVSTALLAEAVDAYSVQVAPAEFAGKMSSAALASAATVTGFATFLKSLIFMSTTSKIIVAASAIVVAVASYHYLTQTTAEPAVKVAESTVQAKPPTALQVALPKEAAVTVTPPAAPNIVQSPPVPPTNAMPAPPASTDPQIQDAMVMMSQIKQTFNDVYKALMQTDDADTAYQKITVLESQMDDLQAKIKGTPLEQQVAPAIKPLRDVRDALQHGDLAGARKIMASLDSMGKNIQTKIQNTAGMTLDQAAKNAGEAPSPN